MLTAEDVVKRIAGECAYVDDRGAVGIRLKPAAPIAAIWRVTQRCAPQAIAPVGETADAAVINP
jgi:hypothetical protein